MTTKSNDLMRLLDRQKDSLEIVEDDSLYSAINKVKDKFEEIQETQTMTLQDITEFYSIIFEIDVDTVSSFFPFRTFFDIFEINYPENSDIIYLLFLLIGHSSMGIYFNPDIIINETDINILIDLLSLIQFTSCSLCIIASICYKNQNYIKEFCEKGLLNALTKIDAADHDISNFLAFLSESALSESESTALSSFIEPLILSENTQIVLNGLIILDNLIKSSIKSLSDYLIEKYYHILIEKLRQFMDSEDEEAILKLLNIFHSIPNLSNEAIGLLFHLISIDNTDNMHDYVILITQIFRDQYDFWKNDVDIDYLFKILLSHIENASFKEEASIFLTLMRYGNYYHLSQPTMILFILKFASYKGFSKICLNALNKLLTLSQSPESLFGDQMQLFIEEISELANNNDENIAIGASLLLEKIFSADSTS